MPATLSKLSRKRSSGSRGAQSTDSEDLFDATKHLGEITEYIEQFDAGARERRLDILELFGGVSRIMKTGTKRGHSAASLDTLIGGDHHNLLTKAGFFNTLDHVLSVKENGLIAGGPPCSWWIFMSIAVHKRSEESPGGDISVEGVVKANQIVTNTIVLMAIGRARSVHELLEQPMTSRMPLYPCYKKFIADLRRFFTWMGCFDHAMAKPSILWSDMPCDSLVHKWTVAVAAKHKKKHKGNKAWKRCAEGGVEGTKELTRSSAYTWSFARAVVKVWENTPPTPAMPLVPYMDMFHQLGLVRGP